MEGILILAVIGYIVYHIIKVNEGPSPPPPPPFSARIRDTQLDGGGRKIPAKEIKIHGLFPITEPRKLEGWISVIDESTTSPEPVFCAIDRFQEDHTPAYFTKCEFGVVEPGQVITKWWRAGLIFPELLHPPYGGQRKLTVFVRLVNAYDLPTIVGGFLVSEDVEVLWQKKLKFTYQFNEKGYREAAEHREEAQILTLKIAMAVAMADGNLDKQEGELMKKWMKKSVSQFSGEMEKELKETLNGALQKSYEEAKSGTLNLESLATRLNEVGETGDKYKALEFAADIMAADGVAQADEMKMLTNLAELLGLDAKRVADILGMRIIKVDPTATGGASAEARVGIQDGWSEDHIKKHLREAFSKWNSRLNTLPEGEERENAQQMLDDIARLRKKYVK